MIREGTSPNWALGIFCALAAITQPCNAQEAMGALYPNNLPGDLHMPPGTFNIQAKVRELSAAARPTALLRLPNGHYLIQTSASAISNPLVELDANLEIVGAMPVSGQFEVRGYMALDPDSDQNSRAWAGGGTMMSSFNWRQLTYDPPFAIDSPYGLRFLQDCADCRSSGGMAIAKQGGQAVVVIAGSEARRPFHYHLLGGNESTLPEFQAPVPDRFTPSGYLKGHAVSDPLQATVWWSNLDAGALSSAPLRFVECELSGELTGRIFQPELPFQPVNPAGIQGIQGADMYLDAEGNRVLAFISSHGGREILAEVNADFVYGSGCNGEIDFIGESLIGGEFDIELSGVLDEDNKIALLWRGTPLLNMVRSIPGLNNCSLHLDLNVGTNFAIVGSEIIEARAASRTLVVPSSSSLVGVEIGFQWVLPIGPSSLPVDLSPAGALRIGGAR